MSKTLKSFLGESHNKKTKDDLIKVLNQLHSSLGDDAFAKVTAVKPSEFTKLNKAEIISVLDSFRDDYDDDWEIAAKAVDGIFNQMESDDLLFSTSNAADADFAAELGDIDFENLIGGPLNACVTAQTNASVATVNFIKEVGFQKADPSDQNSKEEIRMVDFTHNRKVLNPAYDAAKDPTGTGTDTDGNKKYNDETVELKIPFISLLNVPSLRIETCDIDFNVKLNSTYTKNVSNSLGINASVSGGFWAVKFKVSASYRRSSSTGVKVEKQYTMGVKVRATNDEMPAGLERVLGLLAA